MVGECAQGSCPLLRHQRVRPVQAEVEADRADEGELGVEDPHHRGAFAGADHDAAGVQVAVEKGLGAGHEGVAEVGDLRAQAGVGAEGRRQVVQALVPVVVLVLDVRLGRTALGVIRELHARGRLEVVYADETRPLLQGSRLTAWELAQEGIPHYVQADGAAAGTLLRGGVDAAVVGADRIAANGDTATKVGTVGVALACADAGIPFLVAAPTTTVDLATKTGDDIHIELRGAAEVLEWGGIRMAPAGSRGHNPAFDVTPGRLVTGLVTERGVLEVASGRLPDDHLHGRAGADAGP